MQKINWNHQRITWNNGFWKIFNFHTYSDTAVFDTLIELREFYPEDRIPVDLL